MPVTQIPVVNNVKRILPLPIPEGVIRTNWRFIPSTSLGGDAFGYHKIGDDHLKSNAPEFKLKGAEGGGSNGENNEIFLRYLR